MERRNGWWLSLVLTLLVGCNPPSWDGDPIWTEDSAAILILGGSFFEGASGYYRTRGELVAGELANVEAIHRVAVATVENCGVECATLGAGKSVEIIDADGASTEYRAIANRTSCSAEGLFVDAEAVGALFEDLSCVLSKAFGDVELELDAERYRNEDAMPIEVGDGCVHGGFAHDPGEPVGLYRLEVEAGARYTFMPIELQECASRSLRYLVRTAEDEILAEKPVTEADCTELVYDSETTGTVYFEIEKTGGTLQGDVLFSVTREDRSE